MIELEIDGQKVEVAEGSMVMQAANKLGTYIPHFCYHKKLSIAANCRMCLVEVEKAPKPLPACATPATQGMVVRTHSEKAIQAQKGVMEFLLINHPLDCPICDQGGECQLQDLAMGYGASASRYTEEKRVVFHKRVSPLIAMEEMQRCIHCTRCVRFGQEIAGIMELGMLFRGEHAEITTFVGNSIDSELSGNMIDLCPVGALTSRPFRYQARTWELSRRKSISPHDALGSNLMVQIKNNRVLRVLPKENEEINECWLSDRDRFSYEGLNSPDRLMHPMIKQNGEWRGTDWQTALEYVANGLQQIQQQHGADALAALAAPYATLEELSLLQKIMRGMGSENIDFRLRQSDFPDNQSGNTPFIPWLGMRLTEFSALKQIFVVGSFLRKDHPLLSARFRQAAKSGTQIDILHAVDDDWLMPVAHKMICAPSTWLMALGEIICAIAQAKKMVLPKHFARLEAQPISASAQQIAQSLLNTAAESAIVLGNAAVQHPQAAQLQAAVEWIADHTQCKISYLTEAANTVGAYLARAYPQQADKNLQQILQKPRKGFFILHAEPDLDFYDPQQIRKALTQAEMIVIASPYQQGLEYADVLLPIAPFTETAGSYVNCEGRLQSFNGLLNPLGETRPAWKVLRVLGNLLGLADFEYATSEEVRNALLSELQLTPETAAEGLAHHLNNRTGAALRPETWLPASNSANTFERIAEVPIYNSDAIVRRAPALQKTRDAQLPRAYVASHILEDLKLESGAQVRIKQGNESVILSAVSDATLPSNTIRLATAHPATAMLGAMFGAISLERA